jgi:hypothetical protein
MASRRKGEITGAQNERDFPHIVELASLSGGFHSKTSEFDAFHREREVPIRRGRGRQEGYIRFCFPNADHANAFRARFGGELLSNAPGTSKQRTKRIFTPRTVADHIMMQEDFERLHEFLLETDNFPEISNDLRKVIEEEWPELVYKLPPKE